VKENKALFERYEITGYPAVRIIGRNGTQLADYQDSQEPDDIAEHMIKVRNPAYEIFEHEDKLEEWLYAGKTQLSILLVVTDEASTKDLIAGFKRAPLGNHQNKLLYRFGICVNPECVRRYGTDQPPAYGGNPPQWVNASVTLHWPRRVTENGTEVPWHFFQMPLPVIIESPDHILGWAEGVVPAAMEFSMELYSRYSMAGHPMVLLYIDIDWKTKALEMQSYLNMLRECYRNMTGTILFAIADKTRFAADLQQFGLDPKTPGPLWTLRDGQSDKYVAPTGKVFSSETALEWIKLFRQKKLKPMILSEAEPEEQPDYALKIVRSNYRDWLADWTKGVLIAFYAPWCPHSRKFLKEYEVAAKEMEKYSHKVLLTKMDVTKNDAPTEYGVNEYPKIYWHAPSESSRTSPVEYKETRTVLGMIDFLSSPNMTDLVPEFKWSTPSLQPLTPENYTKVTQHDPRHVAVVFHTPMKGFHNSWEMLQNYSHAMRNRPDLLMTEVDPDMYDELAKEEGIDTFPTMKLYLRPSEGEPSINKTVGLRFPGQMKLAEVDRWLGQHLGTYELHKKKEEDKTKEEGRPGPDQMKGGVSIDSAEDIARLNNNKGGRRGGVNVNTGGNQNSGGTGSAPPEGPATGMPRSAGSRARSEL